MSLIVELSGDEANLLRAYQRAREAASKLPPEVDKAAKASEKADKELVKFAEHIKQITTTPLERYTAEMGKVEAAEKKGLITKDQLIRRQTQLREQLDKTSTTHTTVAEEIGDNAQSMLLQYVSLSAGVQLFNQALEESAEKGRQAVEQTERLVNARNAFTQISSSGAQFSGYEQQADQLAISTGLDRQRARQLLFTLESSGIQDTQLAERLATGDTLVGNTESMTNLATRLPRLTGGDLTPQQSINAAIIAAETARVSVDQIQPELVAAYEQFSRTGATPAEVASSVGQASFQFDAPGRRAGAYAARLATNEELSGMTMTDSLRRLQGDAQLRQDVLGDSMEANAFYEFLSNSQNFANVQGSQQRVEQAIAQTGTANDVFQQRLQLRMQSDPQTANNLQRLQSTRRQEVVREGLYGNWNQDNQTGYQDLETAMDQAGTSYTDRLAARLQYAFQRRVMGASGTEAAIAAGAGTSTAPAVTALIAAANLQREAAAELLRGAQSNTGQQRAQANQPRE